jgi:hypothetical protein
MISVLPLGCDLVLLPVMFCCLLGAGETVLLILARTLPVPWRFWEEKDSSIDRPIVAFALGCGATSLAVLGLGAAGLLYIPLFWMALAAGCFAFWKRRTFYSLRAILQSIRPVNQTEWLLAILILAILATAWLGCLMPVIGQDELTYHLTAPRQFLLGHRIQGTPHLLHGNFPFNAEMLYLFCLALGSGTLCKLLQWCVWAMLLAMLLRWVRRIDPEAGFFSVLLYLAAAAGVYYRAPMEAGSDLLVSFYCTLGFQSASRMREKGLVANWRRWLLLAGIAGGLALGTKQTAAAFMGPALGVLISWQSIRPGIALKTVLSPLLIALFVSFALFFPWLLKSFLCTGNPFYPFLANAIPTDSPYKEVSNRAIEFYSKWNFYQRQAPEGASWPRKAALAWQEYRQTRLEWSLHEGDYLLPLYLIFSITGLLLPIPRLRGLAVAGLAGNLIFMAVYGSHLNRFFSMTYPLAALLVGTQLIYLFRLTSVGWLFPPLFGLLIFAGWTNFQYLWGRKIEWDFRPRFTKQLQWHFLEKRFHGSEDLLLWRALEKHTPPDAYLLGHGIHYPYYSPRRIDCTGDFEEEWLDRLSREPEGWNGVIEPLRARGYTHLAIATKPRVSVLPSDWLERHTRLLWRQGELELREIVGSGTKGQRDRVKE